MTGWGLWLAALAAGVVAILAGWEVLNLVGLLMLAAGACFVTNLVRIARHWLRGERLQLREPVVPGRPHARHPRLSIALSTDLTQGQSRTFRNRAIRVGAAAERAVIDAIRPTFATRIRR